MIWLNEVKMHLALGEAGLVGRARRGRLRAMLRQSCAVLAERGAACLGLWSRGERAAEPALSVWLLCVADRRAGDS